MTDRNRNGQATPRTARSGAPPRPPKKTACGLDDAAPTPWLYGPVDLQAEDRWQAIDELIHHLVAMRKIGPEHRDAIRAAVRNRESTMSTGIGSGVGLPHASTDLVDEPVGIIGLSKRGVEFGALDGGQVTRVILFLVPRQDAGKHLHALAQIAKVLRQ